MSAFTEAVDRRNAACDESRDHGDAVVDEYGVDLDEFQHFAQGAYRHCLDRYGPSGVAVVEALWLGFTTGFHYAKALGERAREYGS